MWTSYQAASGVLPLVILGIIVVESLQQKNSLRTRQILSKVWPFAAGYLLATVVFLLIPTPTSNYRDTSMYPLINCCQALFIIFAYCVMP